MNQNKRIILVIFLAVLIVAVLFWRFKNNGERINNDTYQAVILENTQTYFGKLSHVSRQYLKLSDIYYVRNNQPGAPADLTLIKYGNEVHQPEDTMYINRDKVLLWQNLKPEGKIVQLIYQEKLQAAANPAPAAQ